MPIAAASATPFLLGALIGYFVPSLVAFARRRKNPGSVVVTNFFLGWTGIGWIVALAMAFGG